MKVSVAFLFRLFLSGTLLTMTAWTQNESGWRIHTIAGTGRPGHSGDGGPASEARFSFPSGVGSGQGWQTFYVADFFSQRIRRVDTAGDYRPPSRGLGSQAMAETTDRRSRRDSPFPRA